TGKTTPPNPAAVLHTGYGRLTASGKVLLFLEHVAKDTDRVRLCRLPDLKEIGTHPGPLTTADDAGKLGLVSWPLVKPEDGIALFRVGEQRPVVRFNSGRAPGGNAYGLSPDGRFVYWGRRDGTVCVADVTTCFEQLAPFATR